MILDLGYRKKKIIFTSLFLVLTKQLLLIRLYQQFEQNFLFPRGGDWWGKTFKSFTYNLKFSAWKSALSATWNLFSDRRVLKAFQGNKIQKIEWRFRKLSCLGWGQILRPVVWTGKIMSDLPGLSPPISHDEKVLLPEDGNMMPLRGGPIPFGGLLSNHLIAQILCE